MVQYYYDKFTALVNYVYSPSTTGVWGTQVITIHDVSPGTRMGTTYSFVDSTVGYRTGGAEVILGTSDGNYANYYFGSGSSMYRTVSTGFNGSTWSISSIALEGKVSSSYSKGALVQSNIAVEDGTYPANGRHTDGYWYVKGAAVGPLQPGTVINQPYSTEGNGGRKLVRMNNGWLVSAVRKTDNIYFFVSKDNGANWMQLCYISSPNIDNNDFAIVTNGVTVFCIFGWLSGTYGVSHLRFNPTTVTNGPLTANGNIDVSQTGLDKMSLTVDPTNEHLHAAWASKNATYSNNYNIRYAKSTDGGATWTAVEQITTFNNNASVVTGHTGPSIVMRNGKPIIFASARGSIIDRLSWGENYAVLVMFSKDIPSNNYFISSSWGAKSVFVSMETSAYYGQSNPSAVVDKNGVIHVAWQGFIGNTSEYKLLNARSLDGGVTWSSYTFANYLTNPSITTDKTGKLFIIAQTQNGSAIKRFYSVDGGLNFYEEADVITGTNLSNPSTLYDIGLNGTFSSNPPLIYQTPTSVWYTGTYTLNSAPSVTLTSPSNNQTLYENDTINISGDAYDADKDQSVTAYYQINNETRKVLATNLSQTQISLSKQLTFKGGKLYDGETALTGVLADGVAHTLKLWAEDSEKASSAIAERTFYVVPNRAPLLTVDAVVPSGVVDADKFKISGTASDQDANSTVTVTRRINAGNAVEIYNGAGGAWEFDLALSQLVVGQNTIVIEVVDNYGAKTSKTVTLNKKAIKTPILQSVARYKIEPPKGSAMGVLLFIQRDEELDIKVELSMTLNGEQEQYETLTPANTAPVQQGIVEDTFEYEGLEAKQNIILKITPSRTDLSFNHKIHLISGAVD